VDRYLIALGLFALAGAIVFNTIYQPANAHMASSAVCIKASFSPSEGSTGVSEATDSNLPTLDLFPQVEDRPTLFLSDAERRDYLADSFKPLATSGATTVVDVGNNVFCGW